MTGCVYAHNYNSTLNYANRAGCLEIHRMLTGLIKKKRVSQILYDVSTANVPIALRAFIA